EVDCAKLSAFNLFLSQMLSKNDKLAAVIVVYILFIVILAYAGHTYKQYENGAVYGALIGIVLCTIFWFTVGKKYVQGSGKGSDVRGGGGGGGGRSGNGSGGH